MQLEPNRYTSPVYSFPYVEQASADYIGVQMAPGHRFVMYVEAGTYYGRGRHWRGQEAKRDEQGREWIRFIDRLVVDDFGALVEVTP